MVPGRCPETPWSLPGASQEPVQAGFQMQSKIDEKFENSGSPPGRPGRLPGDPEGSPKSTKKIFFAKNGIPNANFCRFLCRKPFFRVLYAIFLRFFTKNRWNIDEKTNSFFHSSARFFQHADPHETSYFSIRKQHFHFLSFCVFCKKTKTKKRP